jgi:hypothetical protein
MSVVEPPGHVRPDRETADLVCGRFTSSKRREAIGERFEVAVPETYKHRYNLAPQQRALIVGEQDGEREAVMAKWVCSRHWAKDLKIAFKMINARAETLTEKPAYRSLPEPASLPDPGQRLLRVGRSGATGRSIRPTSTCPSTNCSPSRVSGLRAPTTRAARPSRAARSSRRRRTSWSLRFTTGCR